jgi:hypothetical protein
MPDRDTNSKLPIEVSIEPLKHNGQLVGIFRSVLWPVNFYSYLYTK